MCSKMSFGLMLWLAVLLAAFLLQSSEGATFRDFSQRHINNPETRAPNPNAYCDLMMRRRGMMNRSCKPRNTFIIDSPGRIQHICRGGGRRVGRRNIFQSTRRFTCIECRSRGRFPNCRYAGRRRVKTIQVACVNRLPVHFHR